MTSPCTFLAWDSDFFGLRIARVQGHYLTPERQNDIANWCAAQDIACLYFLAACDDDVTVCTAEQAGYHLVDIRVTLNCASEKAILLSKMSDDIVVRTSTETDLTQLQEMGRDQFTDSRFYQDQHFPRERCQALYDTWIAKSLRRDSPDQVLVVECTGRAVGYLAITSHASQGIGQISLMAVAPAAHGRGIGAALLDQGIRIFRRQNVHELRVVTQGRNIASQQLYQKFGLRTAQVQLWYHKWF